MTMPPEDLIDELCRKVVIAPDERTLEAALDGLNSALQGRPKPKHVDDNDDAGSPKPSAN
jgi:hypothetical protein